MSLGAAAVCADRSVLLLVDSMGLLVRPGSVVSVPDTRKGLLFPSSAAAGFVSSETDYSQLSTRIYNRDEIEPRALADALYADMLAVHRMIAERLPGLSGPPFLLVVAAGRALLRGPFGDRDLTAPGWLFAGGWVPDYIRPRRIDPAPPASLDEARDTALRLARKCVAHARTLDGVAAVGAPYYLYSITRADGLKEERVPE